MFDDFTLYIELYICITHIIHIHTYVYMLNCG